MEQNYNNEEYGCGFCWDKRKQMDKELFFFDAANNLRVCNFCPHCGRALNGGTDGAEQ